MKRFPSHDRAVKYAKIVAVITGHLPTPEPRHGLWYVDDSELTPEQDAAITYYRKNFPDTPITTTLVDEYSQPPQRLPPRSRSGRTRELRPFQDVGNITPSLKRKPDLPKATPLPPPTPVDPELTQGDTEEL